MIIITGAAGFIGSCMAAKLLEEQYNDLVLVDDFSKKKKLPNYISKKVTALVERELFFDWLDENHKMVQFIFHLGARTDTAEFDKELLNNLNTEYTKKVWKKCCNYGLPLIYASSAATYGMGEFGYKDDHNLCNKLIPLNPYGVSKNEFDKWALNQDNKPYFWAGIKFFNVYGPNEYHKDRMASVIFHAFNQINENGKLKLFKSHKSGVDDGEQQRDFIYVKDAVEVLFKIMLDRKSSGIYNLGTGKAAGFNQLAKACFRALGKEPVIEYIDTPIDIREKYQYFTQADMSKAIKSGYSTNFRSISEGVEDYINSYLKQGKYW